jgi:hypothetical protein
MSEITVNDRRLFNKDGEIKDDAAGRTEDRSEAQEGRTEDRSGAQEGRTEDRSGAQGGKFGEQAREEAGGSNYDHMPPTLSSLIIAMATTVMSQLGEYSPDGGGPPSKPNFPAAKNTIDLLGVLEAKTRGNLDEAEEQLLKTLLYDLRIKYVSLLKK